MMGKNPSRHSCVYSSHMHKAQTTLQHLHTYVTLLEPLAFLSYTKSHGILCNYAMLLYMFSILIMYILFVIATMIAADNLVNKLLLV